jgi:hypothetical protein
LHKKVKETRTQFATSALPLSGFRPLTRLKPPQKQHSAKALKKKSHHFYPRAKAPGQLKHPEPSTHQPNNPITQ